jgi:hypothetical protein
MLGLGTDPSIVVGLHCHPGDWLVYGTGATAAAAAHVGIEHNNRSDTDMGLAKWGERNSIIACDLEAPSLADIYATHNQQAELALKLIAAVRS